MPHDDFDQEPIRGLPEVPPEGERILWQGRPATFALAREALSLYWVAGYFVLLAAWRFVGVQDLMPIGQAIGATVPIMILGTVTCALLLITAWVQARSTVYTVTTARVAMRIGAALTMTLNLPYREIGTAALDLRRGGTGTIAFSTLGDTRLGYLVCWPHVRPWRLNPAQPALRCIPDAQRVANLIAETADARLAKFDEDMRPTPAGAVAAE